MGELLHPTVTSTRKQMPNGWYRCAVTRMDEVTDRGKIEEASRATGECEHFFIMRKMSDFFPL